MKTYKFVAAVHEEYSTLGFIPSWYPNGDPLGGMGVAHDILEHFPGDKGDAEGEFQALGAALFIRGESGYFQRNGNVCSTEEHLSADIPEILANHVYRDGRSSFRPCVKTTDKNLLETCRRIVELGTEEIEKEQEVFPSPSQQEHIAHIIASGYKRAAKRYRQHDSGAIAFRLFKEIEEQADRALKKAEEGAVFTVRVNLARMQAATECDYYPTAAIQEDSYS